MQRNLMRETVELDGRFVRTVIELTRDPGAAIRGYLDGRRARLFNPGKYLLVNATLFLLVVQLFGARLFSAGEEAVLGQDLARSLEIGFSSLAYVTILLAILLAPIHAWAVRDSDRPTTPAEALVVHLFMNGHVWLVISCVFALSMILGLPTRPITLVLLLAGSPLYAVWLFLGVHGVSLARAIEILIIVGTAAGAFTAALIYALVLLAGAGP